MNWNERMSTQIVVGKSYKNRDGVIMDIVEKITENDYLVTNKDGAYNDREFGNGYIVTKYGGFGSYPNHRDLINPI